MRDTLLKSQEDARQSIVFRNYLKVRERVLDMLEEQEKQGERPSKYWEQELAGFDYMLDASPLIIQKLREHCYHLTGLRANEYRSHHGQNRELFARKLQALRKQDEENLLVPESPLLGGFGHAIDGVLINLDTLKMYECLIALNKAGLLTQFRSNIHDRKVVLEIGAGWGGFAYQFKTLCPNVTYIIVDLPQTLLFSAAYLRTVFPFASILMYGDKPEASLLQDFQSYDFIFLPHFFAGKIQLSRIDLTINIVSFQEMTSEQVNEYVRKAHELGCPSFYSLNRERSRYNNQLTSVSAILSKFYDIAELKVLDIPYTVLIPSQQGPLTLRLIKIILRRLLGWRERLSIHSYRHLIGTRKAIP